LSSISSTSRRGAACLPLCAALAPWSPIYASSERNPVAIALVISFLVISLGIHEAAHAWMAALRGDTTAKDMGRMTLNPLAHIDPFMTVLLPAVMYMTTGFVFGGAKPVPVVAQRLRHPLRDMMLVALAGPASNLILAFLFAGAFSLSLGIGGYSHDQILPEVLYTSAVLNVLLAVFNLLPLPPLDGSRVMTWLLPRGPREAYASLERFGILIVLMAISLFPGIQALINTWVVRIMGFLLRITGS
jgi:Zn-dependent protease